MIWLPDQPNPIHEDLGAYITGHLDPDERRDFETHLETCADCQRELADLIEVDALVKLAPAAVELPEGLEDRALDRFRLESAMEDGPAPAISESKNRKRFRWPRLNTGFGMAGLATGIALVAVAFVVGLNIGGDGDTGVPGPGGELELAATLTSVNGQESAGIDVTKLPSGREVDFHSSSLPILPTGEFYELWFVGPGDRPGHRNRISAGTFHPDEQGETSVILHAAVDPTKFPEVEVTEEDGPEPDGAIGLTVLRTND